MRKRPDRPVRLAGRRRSADVDRRRVRRRRRRRRRDTARTPPPTTTAAAGDRTRRRPRHRDRRRRDRDAATEPPDTERAAATVRRRRSTRTATARSSSASPPPARPTTAPTTRRSSTPPRSSSEENGFDEPIVVDNIQAADAATAIGDLAQQGVDVIIVGASEIAEPLPQLIERVPGHLLVLQLRRRLPGEPGPRPEHRRRRRDQLHRRLRDRPAAAGAAAATRSSFIGCCDLGFEKQAYLAFELGLQAVDPAYTMTYVPTGDFPFDFDNTANATAALQTAIDEGADAVYPYLGGAHRPVVQAANEAGLITMSAGSSTVCETDGGARLRHRRQVRRRRLRAGRHGRDHRRRRSRRATSSSSRSASIPSRAR